MYSEIEGINIVGISTVVPPDVYSNLEYDLLNDVERKMMIKTIGVEQRYVAKEGVTTSDLAVDAANKLFKETGWKKEDVDVLIFVTQSRDYYLPSVGPIAQDRLGLPKTCMSFDVGLGCSGYVYGLNILTSLLKANNRKKGVLLAGDISTISCSYNDTSSYPLFGDAATATFIEINEGAGGSIYFDLNSDGAGENAIKIKAGGLRNRPSIESFEEKEHEDGNVRSDFHLALKGIDIFNFSVGVVPKSVIFFCERYNLNIDDIDLFVMHQANFLMNETIRKKLKIDKSKVPYSIHEYGNTSSASIPLTLSLEGEIKGENILLSGFGVGLSWANAFLKNVTIPYLITSTFNNNK